MPGTELLDDGARRAVQRGIALDARIVPSNVFVADDDPANRQGNPALHAGTSGRKRIYLGVYTDTEARPHRAVMAVYRDERAFQGERSAYLRLANTRVGPAFYENLEFSKDAWANWSRFAQAHEDGGGGRQRDSRDEAHAPSARTLCTEYVGIDLEAAIRGSVVPGSRPEFAGPLHAAGSPEGSRETEKILLDIAFQLSELHRRHLVHADVRPRNVCVMRHGPNPEDLRATFVDLELVRPAIELKGWLERDANTRPSFFAQHRDCYRALFRGTARPPEPYQYDLGYFALLAHELAERTMVEDSAGFDREALNEAPTRELFWYGSYGKVGQEPVGSPLLLQDFCGKLADSLDVPSAHDYLSRLDPLVRRHFSWADDGGWADAKMRSLVEGSNVSLFAGHLEEFAGLVYEAYLGSVEDGAGRPQTLLELDPEFRESTLAFARSVWTYVDSVLSMAILPANGPLTGHPLEALDPEDRESIMQAEHLRWIREREGMGWTLYDPHVHPAWPPDVTGAKWAVGEQTVLMKPYSMVRETPANRINEAMADAIVPALRKVGFVICPR